MINLLATVPYYWPLPDGVHPNIQEHIKKIDQKGWYYYYSRDEYKDNARNIVANGKYDHYLFIDPDTVFFGNIIELIKKWVKLDEPIIAGKYPYKEKNLNNYAVAGTSDKGLITTRIAYNSKGIKEVDWCGIGMIMIKKEVFNRMSKPYFARTFYNGKYLEDYMYFCTRAKEFGFKIYIDCDIEIKQYDPPFKKILMDQLK